MTAALLALLCSHAVGDLLLQTGWMVDHKHSGWVLVLHVAVVALLSAAFLGGLPWLVLGVVFVTHLGMDALKVHGLGNDLRAFSMDQALHLVVMPALAVMVPSAAANGIWSEWLSSPERLLFLQAQVVLIALIVGLRVGGIVIGLMMKPFVCQLDDQQGVEKGLTGAGRRLGAAGAGGVVGNPDAAAGPGHRARAALSRLAAGRIGHGPAAPPARAAPGDHAAGGRLAHGVLGAGGGVVSRR